MHAVVANPSTILIGRDGCLDRTIQSKVTITCPILSRDLSNSIPEAYPRSPLRILDFPIYTIFKDGVQAGEFSRDNRLNIPVTRNSFVFLEAFSLLSFRFVEPPPYSVFGSGDICLDWAAPELIELPPDFPSYIPRNIPPSVNQSNLRDFVFESILGNWTCAVRNRLGSDVATTIFEECSK